MAAKKKAPAKKPPRKKASLRETSGTPKRKRAKPLKDWAVDFINELRTIPIVTVAARASGVSRSTVYRRKDDDAEFRAAMEDAIEEGADVLEAEAHFRAKDGIEYPVSVGEEVHWIRRPSDKLLLRYLEMLRPDGWAPSLAREMAAERRRGRIGKQRFRVVVSDG